MIESELQREIDTLDVVIMELRQDLDVAMCLRQVWENRLAEHAPPYFEVDAAHWDNLLPEAALQAAPGMGGRI